MADLRPIPPSEMADLADALRDYLGEIDPGEPIDASAIAARYVGDPARYPYWIMSGPDRAGFALAFTHPDGLHELAEFTIFADHRREGLGMSAARALLRRYPGRWQFGVVKLPAAEPFWRAVLAGTPGLSGLIEGAPRNDLQITSFAFTITGDVPCPT